MMIHKRNFPRKFVQIPAVLGVRNLRENKVMFFKEKALIVNLSAGGAFFLKYPNFSQQEIEDLLNKKSKLVLEFFLPNYRIPVLVTGYLKWVENKMNFLPDVSEFGVEFDDISKEDILEITKYISGEIKETGIKKREFVRIPVYISILLKQGFHSAVTDININGICVTVKPLLDEGHINSFLDKILHIKLKLGEKKISATGKIMWVENFYTEKEKFSKLGIKFTKISAVARRNIAKLILKKSVDK